MWNIFSMAHRSIARNLIFGLLLMIIIISGIGMYISLQIATKRTKSDLNSTSNEIINSITEVVMIPLWNFDSETIQAIGKSYTQNIFIAALQIKNDTGVVFFDMNNPNQTELVTQSRNVFYKGKKIGYVTVSFTATYYTTVQRHIFWTYGIIFMSMMLILFIGSGVLLQLLLRKPLNHFTHVVKAYATGDSDAFKRIMPYRELQPFSQVLNEMGDTITKQINELKQNERRYRTLVEQIPAATYTATLDKKRSSLFMSPQIEDISGFNPGQWIDEPEMWLTLLHPEDRNRVELEMAVAQKHEKPFLSEYRLIHRNKQCIWVHDQAVIVKDDTGKALFRQGLMSDITYRKKVEKEKRDLEAQLLQTQKMEAIGTLAGGIAHDFNNILSVIIGYSELCMDYTDGETPLKTYLEEILRASQRAKDLINQILAFSRQDDQERKPVQIKLIVKEALKFLKASLPATIDIQNDIRSDALVMASPTHIHQVLMNLCTNAAHAMLDSGGTLIIALSDEIIEPSTDTRYSGLAPGTYSRLSVSDTGHGMRPDIINHIFNPFFTTKDKGEGTGMGLSVVHGIVKSNRGTITVESKLGQGSTFTILLPSITQKTAPVKHAMEEIPTGCERILFVDDEPAIADVGKQTLEAIGYNVTVKTSSIEALAVFQKYPDTYDLVITDMTMPDMTGEELARNIFRIKPTMPIILCTGFSAKIDKKKARELGFRAFAYKPLLKHKIARSIRDALDQTENG